MDPDLQEKGDESLGSGDGYRGAGAVQTDAAATDSVTARELRIGNRAVGQSAGRFRLRQPQALRELGLNLKAGASVPRATASVSRSASSQSSSKINP